jgi:hypothetical protein
MRIHPFLAFRRFWQSDRGLAAFLVIILVTAFVLPPLVSPGRLARLAFGILFALLLVTGTASVTARRATRAVLTAVAIAAIALQWIDQAFPSPGLDLAGALAAVTSAGLLALVVLVQAFRAGPVTMHRIQGAIAAYLLLGITWASAYHFMSLLDPGAIVGTKIKPGGGATSFMYFSFVTLTTVGYGDVTPVHEVARSLALLEALTGQLYPAILLARLVSLEVVDRQR